MSVHLFVGSLSYEASSQSIADFIWDWVVPENAMCVSDRDTGRNKGFGFITVATPEDAVAACRAQGELLLGRPINISVSRDVRRGAGYATSSPRTAFESDSLRVELSVSALQEELRSGLAKLPDEDAFWVRNSLTRMHEIDADKGSLLYLFDRLVHLLAEQPSLMTELEPRLFEHLVACLLAASGYKNVRLTVPSADGGVDIWADKNAGLGRTRTLIQCKRYAPARKISRPDVQLVYGVLSASSATNAAVVTTSTFTQPARAFVKENEYRMSGLDGVDLKNWLEATEQVISPRSPPPRPRGDVRGEFRHRSW